MSVLRIRLRVVPVAKLLKNRRHLGELKKCERYLGLNTSCLVRVIATSTAVIAGVVRSDTCQVRPIGSGIRAVKTSPIMISVQFSLSNVVWVIHRKLPVSINSPTPMFDSCNSR